MADWQTPKTDWGVEPFGPGDFNRIEGNTEYLKQQQDEMKAKINATRFIKGITPEISADSSYTITHGLNSTDVLVSLQTVSPSLGLTAYAPQVRHRILNANQVAIDNLTSDTHKVSYVIYKMNW